jgi:hypothetical protein
MKFDYFLVLIFKSFFYEPEGRSAHPFEANHKDFIESLALIGGSGVKQAVKHRLLYPETIFLPSRRRFFPAAGRGWGRGLGFLRDRAFAFVKALGYNHPGRRLILG